MSPKAKQMLSSIMMPWMMAALIMTPLLVAAVTFAILPLLLDKEQRSNDQRRQSMATELADLTCIPTSGGRVCRDARLAKFSYRCVVIGGVATLILSPKAPYRHTIPVHYANCGIRNSLYTRMP
jgi:preprotein translocase subunit YajC